MAPHCVAWWLVLLTILMARTSAQTAEPSIIAFVTATGGALHVTWTISLAWINVNSKDAIRGFMVLLDDKEMCETSPDTTFYDLYGLTNNTEHRVQVNASLVDAPPLLSDVIVATTLDRSAPDIPASPTELTVSGGFIQVGVQPPLDTGGTDLFSVTVVVWQLGTLTEVTRLAKFTEDSDLLVYDIYGLDAQTRYRISAFATNVGTLSSSESSPLVVSTGSLQLPGPCPSATVLATTGASVLLKLNPPQDDGGGRIQGYNVYMTTDGDGGDFVEVASTFGSDVIDTVEIVSSSEVEYVPLLSETQYFFKVVAINLVDICVAVSSSLQLAGATNATTALASIPGQPPSPYLLKATGGMITMSLIKPLNMQGAILTGFLIAITDNDGSSFTSRFESSDDVAYDAVSLQANRSYSVLTAVTTNLGTSSYSIATIMNTTDPSTPTPPRDLEVQSVTGSGATVKWSSPLDNGGVDISGYTILLLSLGSQEERSVSSSSSFLKNLAAETVYTVKVIATNANGKNSSRSIGATFTTLAPSPPSEPQGITSISASGGAIEVVWNSPMDRGGELLDFMGYKISAFFATSCFFDKETANPCSKCNSVKVSVEQYQLLSSASSCEKSTTSCPDDSAGCCLTREGYTYRMPCGRMVSAKEPKIVKGTTSVVFNGLNYSSTYYFSVQANNQAGKSDSTAFQGLRTTSQTPPSPPSNLRQLSATGGSVQLTWNEPQDTGGGPIVGYHVYRNYELLTPSYITSPYTDCGFLVADTTYVYSVAAVNASLVEGALASLKISTEMLSNPLPPILSLTRSMYNALHVHVTPPCDTGGEELLSYYYQVKFAGVLVDSASFDCCKFVVNDLEPNRNYTVFAKVENTQSFASRWTEEMYKTTSGIPSIPDASMSKVSTYSALINLESQPHDTEIVSYDVLLFQNGDEIQRKHIECQQDVNEVGQYACPNSYKLELLESESEYTINVGANGPLGSINAIPVWFKTSSISSGVFGMSKTNYSADKEGVIRTQVIRSNGASGSVTVGVNTTEPESVLLQCKTVPGDGCNCILYLVSSGAESKPCTLTFVDGQESADVIFTMWNDDSAELLPSLVTVGPFGVDLAAQHGARLHTEAWQQTGLISFSKASSQVLEDESFAMVNVVRLNGTTGQIAFDFESFDINAVAGEDYLAVNGTGVMQDQQSSAQIWVQLSDNHFIDVDKAFGLRLTGQSVVNDGSRLVTHKVTIRDDESISNAVRHEVVNIITKYATGGEFKVEWTNDINDAVVISGYLVRVSTPRLGTFFNVYNITEASFTLSGLLSRSVYHVEVAAWNAFGLGKYADPIVVTTTDVTPPGPPISLSKAYVTNTEFQLIWEAPRDNGGSVLYGYRLSVKDNDENVVVLASVSSRQVNFVVKGLNASSIYACYVSSFTESYQDYDQKRSTAQLSVSTTVGWPPGQPPAVKLLNQARGGSLTFSLELPKDTGGKPLTNCTLYMSKVVESGSGTEEFKAGCKVELTGLLTPSCTVNNLLASTSYEVYSVFSNVMGDSPEGDHVVFQTSAVIDLPSPPLNFRASSITAGNIELKWDAPANLGGASDVVGYIVYQKHSVSTNGYFTLYDGQDSKEQSFTARGLHRSTAYAFAVVALTNASYCADPSSYSVSSFLEVSTLPYSRLTPPGQPFILSATGGAITLGWSTPNDLAGVDMGGYYVELLTPTTGAFESLGSVPPSETTFIHYGLSEITPYSYAVTATNQDGASERSVVFTTTTLAASKPTAVRALHYSDATGGSILLAWDAPLDGGGLQVHTYEILRDRRSDKFRATTTVFEDRSRLNAETSYTYRVTAFNGVFYGPTTSVVVATGPPSLPDPPQFGLSPFGGRIEVSWLTPEYTGGIPITEYSIFLLTADGINTIQSTTTSAQTHIFRRLQANTEYSITGKAHNAVGASSQTIVTISTAPVDSPGAPPKPTATDIRGGRVTIHVELPDYTGGEDVALQLYMNGDKTYTFAEGERDTTIYGLVAETEYTFRVSASNSHSEIKSDIAAVTTSPISEPGQVQNLKSVSVSFNQMTLIWDIVQDTGGDQHIEYLVTYYKCNSDGVKNDLEPELTHISDTNTILIKELQYSTFYCVIVVAMTTTSLAGSTSLPLVVATEQPLQGVIVAEFVEVSVKENASAVLIPITRLNGSYGEISYSFETIDGDAVAGSNYETTQNTRTLAESIKTDLFEIPIINDQDYNPGISFRVGITDTSTGLVSTTSVVLEDDGDAGFISFTKTTLSVYESNRTTDLTVTRVGGVSPAAVIQPVIVKNASLMDRFHLLDSNIMFAVGDTENTISVEINDDFEFQYVDDSITITFEILEGGVFYGTNTIITLTALDDGDISLPKPCTNLHQRSRTGGSLELQWISPVDRGGRDITLTYVVSIIQVNTVSVRTQESDTETTFVYGLSQSTSYYVSVQAKNSIGSGLASTTSMFTTPSATPPTAPLNVRVTSLSSSIAQIAWTAPLDDGGAPIIAYTIYRISGTDTLSVFNSTNCGLQTVCTISEIRQLLAQTSYNIRVQGSTAFMNGELSDILSFTTPEPTFPDPPPLAVVSWTSAGAMTIQMSDPVNIGGSNIQLYRLFMKAEGDDDYYSVYYNALKEHTVYGLRYQTVYYFRYQVENAAGPSDYSPIVYHQTLTMSLPSAPLNVQEGTKTGGAITLLWEQPLDVGGRVITGYTIRIASIGGLSANVVGYDGKSNPSREGTVYGLIANTEYSMQVVAYLEVSNCFDSVEQAWSEVIRVKTSLATVPTPAPELLVGRYTGGIIELVWTPPKDKGGVPLTGYTIYFLNASGAANVLFETNDASVLSFVHNDLTATTSYSYWIRTFNEAGTSPNSLTLIATTDTITFPSVPLNVQQLAYKTGGAITIGWDRSIDTGGQPIAGYEVYRNEMVVSGTLSADTRSYINKDGLVASTSYNFTVRTIAQNGLSSMASEVCTAKTTIATKPQKVQTLSAIPGSSYLNVSWVPDGDSGGLPITAYEVRLTLGTTVVATNTGTITYYLFKGLTADTIYTGSVKTSNDGGASDVVSVSMTTTSLTKPNRPEKPLGTSVFGGNFTIQVYPPEFTGGSPITDLNVYEYVLGVAKLKVALKVVVGAPTQYTFVGVSASTKYVISCSAINSAGEGPLSESTTIETTTLNQPGPVLLAPVFAGATGTTLSFTWSSPADTGGSLDLSYFVRVANSNFEAINPSISLSFTATQLAYNSAYDISVAATNIKGNGTWSPKYTAKTQPDAAGEFSFVQTSVSVFENATQVSLSVQRVSGLSGRITLTYRTETAGTRPAVLGSDYAVTKGSTTPTWTIVFAPLQSQSSIVILILNDEGYESPDETFAVRIVSLVSSEKEGTPKIGSNNLATVTIVDDGDAGFVSFEKPNYSFSEDARTATISIIREYGKSTSISLSFEFWGGTATADLDYRRATAPVVMDNGVTISTLTFTIVNDKTFEFPDEFFLIKMSVASGGAILRQPLTRVTILDDGDVSNPGTCRPPDLLSRTGGSATFSIAYPEHNGSTAGVISNYVVRLSTGTSSIDYVKPVAPTFTIAKLTASTTYTVSVAASTSFGNGTFSTAASFSTTSPTPPGPTFLLSVESKTGGRLSLSWTPPDDTGGVPITKYRLYVDSQVTAENLQPTTRATAYGLTASTTYSFAVQAGNIINDIDTWGDMSAVFKFSTAGVTQPGPLALVPGHYQNATGGKVYLSWKAPLDTGGTTISSYSIFAKSSSWPCFLATTVSPKSEPLFASVASLNASTSYEFFVLATNEIVTVRLPGNFSIEERSQIMRTTSDLSGWLSVGSVITIQDAWFVVGDMTNAPTGSIQLKYAHSFAAIASQPGDRLGQATTFNVLSTSAPTLPDLPPAPKLSIATGGMINMTLLSPEDTGGIPILGFALYWNGEKLDEDNYLKTTSRVNFLHMRAFVSVAGLKPSTSYNASVVALNSLSLCYFGRATTGPNVTNSTTIVTTPGAPRLVTSRRSGGGITMNIIDPHDTGGSDIQLHWLYFKQNDTTADWQLAYTGTKRQAIVAPLMPQTDYAFLASVNNGFFNSMNSTVKVVKTTNRSPPGSCEPPTLVNSTGGMIALSWNYPADDGGSIVTDYYATIASSLDGSERTTVKTNTTSCVFYRLLAQSSYDVVIRANNSFGIGPESPIVNFTTMVATPPEGKIEVTVVTTTGGAASISFDEPIDLGGVLRTDMIYNFYLDKDNILNMSYQSLEETTYGTSTGARRLSEATSQQLTTPLVFSNILLGGMDPETLYGIQIFPISKYASGGMSSSFTIMTTSPTITSAPVDLTVDLLTGGSVTLSWEAPVDSGGIPLNTYSLKMASSKDGPFTELYKDMPRITRIDQLNPSTKYWVYVTAWNDKGESPRSSTLDFSTRSITPPSPPQGVQITSVGFDFITCSWSVPDDVGGDAIDHYIVTATKTNDPSALAQTFSTKETSTTLIQLVSSTAYSVSVKAENTMGDVGSTSFTRHAITSSALNKLAAPHIGCVSHNSVELLWYTYPGAVSFNILRDGNNVRNSVITLMAVDSQGLSAGTSYTYTIEAITATGSKYSSDSTTVTTLDASYTSTDFICRGNVGHINELGYENNTKKQWRVDPTTLYSYITLTFSSFVLECDHDFVEIFDASTKERWWKGGCERRGRFVYQTQAPVIIAFTSDASIAHDGFEMQYEIDGTTDKTQIPPPGDGTVCTSHGRSQIDGSCVCSVGFTGEGCNNRIVCCSDPKRCHHPVCDIDPAKVIVVSDEFGDEEHGTGQMMDASEKGTASKAVKTLAKAVSLSKDKSVILVYPGKYSGVMNRDLQVHSTNLIITTLKGPFWTIVTCDDSARFISCTSSIMVVDGLTLQHCKEKEGGVFNIVDSDFTGQNMLITDTVATQNGGVLFASGSNVTFKRAGLTKSSASMEGGALYVKDSRVMVITSNVTKSTAVRGGVVVLRGASSMSGSESVFTDNTASESGGGVFVSGIVSMKGVSLVKNEATTGGGLAMDNGELTMESCSIVENKALSSGGGLALSGTTILTTIGTYIQRNVAVTTGGGVYATGVTTILFDKQATSQSSIEENHATTGAGMYVSSPQASLKGIRIENGIASASAGGIAIVDSTVDWESVVVQANKAQEGGGLVLRNSRLICKGLVLLKKNTAVDGGAVWINKGTMDGVAGTHFHSNTVSKNGGAFFVAGDSTVKNVKVESHDGLRGGCMYVANAALNLVGSELSECSATVAGGGIWMVNGEITADAVSVSLSDAPEGGGLYCSASTISGSMSFKACSAVNRGGGVYTTGVTNLSGIQFDDCTSKEGGAVYMVDADTSIAKSTLTNSRASEKGGGLYVTKSKLKLQDVDVIKSHSDFVGGGVYLEIATVTHQGMSVESCDANIGGGLYLNNSEVSALHPSSSSQIAENTALDTGGNILLSESSSVENLDVLGGTADSGGGITLDGSISTIKGCSLTNNFASFGGGLYVKRGSICTLVDSVIANNTAEETGGGMNVADAVVWHDGISVSFNVAPMGAGVFSTGVSRILQQKNSSSQALFQGNDALGVDSDKGFGGGVYIAPASRLEASGLELLDGKASRGAGIYVDGAMLTLTNSLLQNGSASDGGGVYASYVSTLSLKNCSFISNNASMSGSGGAIGSGGIPGTVNTLSMSNCSLTANSAGVGGGIMLTQTNITGSDNILTENFAKSGGAIAVISECSVLISNWNFINNTLIKHEVGVQGGSIYIKKGTITITDSQLISNDKATLALNGGIIYVENEETTLTIANSLLQSGQGYSGGIIYSVNAYVYIKNSTLYRGFGYDYGAGIFAVSTFLDITNSYFYDNFAFYDGGAIYMRDGGTLTTRNSFFDYNAVQDRGGAIFLDPGAGVDCTVTNSNFTRNTNVGFGSTIFVGRKNTARLADCIISGNGGSGTEGGALNAIDATVEIDHSVFEFNTATKGAAIQISRAANLSMKQSIIRDNSAGLQGGAVHVSVRAIATLTDSIVEANTAGEGGAVYAMGSACVISSNTSFIANNASSFGGAISIRGSAALNATGSTFADNSAYTGGAVSIQNNASLAATDNEFQNNSAIDFGAGIYIDKVTETETQPISCNTARFSGNAAVAGTDIYWVYYPWFTFQCVACTSLIESGNIFISTNAMTVTPGWWPPIVTSGVSLGTDVQTALNSSVESALVTATSSRRLTVSTSTSSQGTDATAKLNASLVKPGSIVFWPTVVVRDYYGAIASYDNVTRCQAAKSEDEDGVFSFIPSTWVDVDEGYIIFKGAEVLSRFRDEPYQLNVNCTLSSLLDKPIVVDIVVDKCNPGYENVNGLCLPCEKGTYSMDGEKCYLCPTGASCEQKDANSRSSYAASSCDDPESWPADDPCRSIDISDLTTRIHECASEKSETFSKYWSRRRIYSCLSGNEYYACDTNTACSPANVSDSTASVSPSDQCADGYSGIMCAICADGFYKGSSGSCKQCSDPNDPAIARTTRMLAMLPVIVAIGALVFLCYLFSNTAEQCVLSQAQAAKKFQIYTGRSRTQMLLQAARTGIKRRVRSIVQSVADRARFGKQPRQYLFQIEPRAVEIPAWRPEKFKIMLGFFQIIGSFKNVYEIPWPNSMSHLMDICSLADFNFVDTTAAECLFKRDYFTNYRLALYALVGMLLLVFLVTFWGILRYRVKLSTLPRHCVGCGLPVFTLQHRAPPILERRKTLVAQLNMEKKTRAASINKSSIFQRLKSRLGVSAEQTLVRRISHRFMRLAARFLNKVDRLTQLPASISTHSPRCPTSQRIKNDVLEMVVHSNLRLWRARMWMRLYYKAYQNRCIKLFFWVLLLFYPMLCQRVIGTFYCDEVGSHYYLSLDRSNLCYEGTWLYYLPLSIVLIVFWVAGVPLLFWVIISLKRSRGVHDTLLLIQDPSEGALKQRLLLKMGLDIISRGQHMDEEKLQIFETEMLAQYLRDTNLNEPSTVAQVGFIYHSYSTAFWWFEVWDLGRKLFLNCVISLLAKAGANRIICGLVVLLVYLSVMLFYKPYRDPSDSALAGVTHIQLFITLFCGLILKMGLLYLDERVVQLVTNAAIITNIVTLVYAVFSILNEKRTAVKMAERSNREDQRRAVAKHVRKLWHMAYGYALTQVYLNDPYAGPMSLPVMTELARRERCQRELGDLNAQLELTSAISPPVADTHQNDEVLSAAQVEVFEGEPVAFPENEEVNEEINPNLTNTVVGGEVASPDDNAECDANVTEPHDNNDHSSTVNVPSTDDGQPPPVADLQKENEPTAPGEDDTRTGEGEDNEASKPDDSRTPHREDF